MKKYLYAAYITFLTVALILFINTPILAQKKITLNELFQSPDSYYGSEVILSGTIAEVFFNGFILRSDIGWQVEIYTDWKQEKGKSVEAIVLVEEGKRNDVPILKMIQMKPSEKNRHWLYIIGALAFLAGGLRLLPK